ncbi:MAG: hypothetical protein L0027_14200, partial [Candidatus Rokubacteria bacterium]|nr:hypothetical protein [Candidatus Rokubacteria bacterium]
MHSTDTPRSRFRGFAGAAPIAVFGLFLFNLTTADSLAAVPELSFLSVEETARFPELADGGLHPQLEARFAGGESHRIPVDLVFDAEILETLPMTRRDAGLSLGLRDVRGARLVALLAFDVDGWLDRLGRSAADLTAVDLLLWQFPRSASRDLRFVERLGVFAPPAPAPGAPAWDAETLSGMALSWNEAGERGLHPVERRPPYPAELRLATAEAAE